MDCSRYLTFKCDMIHRVNKIVCKYFTPFSVVIIRAVYSQVSACSYYLLIFMLELTGKHKYVKLPQLYDISGYGIPWRTWNQIEILHSSRGLPQWMFYLGKWGNPRNKCHPLSKMGLNICQITDGPSGIPKKKHNFVCGNAYARKISGKFIKPITYFSLPRLSNREEKREQVISSLQF